MQRRSFLKTLSTVASFTAVAAVGGVAQRSAAAAAEPNLLKPKRLKPGATLGLVAPGSFITEKELQESQQNLEALGFKVAYSKTILAKEGYLAGTDAQRAEALHEMFSRNDIHGIVAARGGYGCTRLLPLLDYELIQKHPKVLVGYSDITALLFAIFRKTGLVCFHGPVGVSTFNPFSTKFFTQVLMEPRDRLTLQSIEETSPKAAAKPVTIRNVTVRGRLVGGNLSLVVSLIGTPYDVDTANKIIFLEEVGEEPYRVDRMITQMLEAGKFAAAAGVALGVFSDCLAKPGESGITSSFSVEEVLSDLLGHLDIPVVSGLSFGHIRNKFTLPFGGTAELNGLTQTLTLLEPAVV